MQKIIAEYLWLDVKLHMRSKYRTLVGQHTSDIVSAFITRDVRVSKKNVLEIMPNWNYDGSSTGQCTTEQSEAILDPVNVIPHPFLRQAVLVLCQTLARNGQPLLGNSRFDAEKAFDRIRDKHIWFGLEQEFFFFDKETKKPLGWKGRQQLEQGEYYCGINRSTESERAIMTELLETSLRVGLSMSGINQEVAPAQWEYQIGPVEGIEAADQMIFAKYILFSLCQKHNLYGAFHPKPLNGDWNGSGCHVNLSTKEMREEGGMKAIKNAIEKMSNDHENFIKRYTGRNNDMRLTGKHETSSMDTFSWSVGGRNTSVRVPYDTGRDGKGYLEDRRPGSSIDYYETLAKYTEYV